MIVLILAILGLCMGSFAYATVWRLHEQTKKHRTKNHAQALSIVKGRSMCDSCGHTLSALDLIPLISWLSLGGKCRYCRKPISWVHPATEILTAGLFVASYVFWPYANINGSAMIALFVTWLCCLVCFVILGIYDVKWLILPDKVNIVLTIFAAANFLALVFASGSLASDELSGLFISFIILPGLFAALYFLSGGKWIGFGDVKLAPSLALLVPSASLALLTLFLASFLGSVISVVGLSSGKLKRTSHIPFGPFLILATIIVYIWGGQITSWFSTLMGVTP